MFWEPADWISALVNGDPLALLPLVPSAARFASHASSPLSIGRRVGGTLNPLPKSASTGTGIDRLILATNEGPITGIARLDELAIGTPNYSRWKTALERKGFIIEETQLDGNLSAYIDDVVAQEGKIISGRVFVDTQEFAYLDMLHKSRHIGQLIAIG